MTELSTKKQTIKVKPRPPYKDIDEVSNAEKGSGITIPNNACTGVAITYSDDKNDKLILDTIGVYEVENGVLAIRHKTKDGVKTMSGYPLANIKSFEICLDLSEGE